MTDIGSETHDSRPRTSSRLKTRTIRDPALDNDLGYDLDTEDATLLRIEDPDSNESADSSSSWCGMVPDDGPQRGALTHDEQMQEKWFGIDKAIWVAGGVLLMFLIFFMMLMIKCVVLEQCAPDHHDDDD
eukprot:CAMPEP_0177636852 /NCGR_PEP_ID=MMETSP0447-20121125/4658_1 /TAXON_ID=0 /ORGANISM="Stygamoeba regulata, Strain BSH-02190019" /LENGTH=129 /DNA_ID=CAMNT_0019138739 /DNA_START=176 /DNA_END=565 /DNA_ORIENTATION=-